MPTCTGRSSNSRRCQAQSPWLGRRDDRHQHSSRRRQRETPWGSRGSEPLPPGPRARIPSTSGRPSRRRFQDGCWMWHGYFGFFRRRNAERYCHHDRCPVDVLLRPTVPNRLVLLTALSIMSLLNVWKCFVYPMRNMAMRK